MARLEIALHVRKISAEEKYIAPGLPGGNRGVAGHKMPDAGVAAWDVGFPR